jgi:hypothetical protein
MLIKVRDIALTVMAILVSIVCAGVIYYAVAVRSAISDIGKPDPEPAVTSFEDLECVGEVPPPGC